jgi:hypothetical protein
MALACGPGASGDGETTDTGSSGAVDSADDGVEPESSSSETSASTMQTSGDESEGSSTGVAPDPCAAGTPPTCPAGCVEATVYTVDDVASCDIVAPNATRCVSGTTAPSPRVPLTFHRGDEFVMLDVVCGDAIELDGWDECDLVGADDPAGCACFCREGVCPGDEDRLAVEACEVEALCPPLEIETGAPIDPDAAACILTALRDRTPGFHESAWTTGKTLERTLAFGDGSDTLRIVQHRADDFLVCPDDASGWEPAERCTLAAPEVFDACLAETDQQLLAQCLIPEMTWFTAPCEAESPACE